MKDIKRTEPVIDISGKYYKVCSLNCDMADPQFYYHFAYPTDANKKLWNFSYQEKTGRPDHISFHKDGQFQLTLKQDKDKHKGIYKSNDGVFLPNNNVITPLLVHSIYQNNGEYYLPLVDMNDEVRKKNVLMHNGSFSVLMFLTPDKFAPRDFLNIPLMTSPYGNITAGILGASAGRILAWEGWAIDYLLSDLVLELPKDIPADTYHGAFAYVDLPFHFRDLFLQRLTQYQPQPLNML